MIQLHAEGKCLYDGDSLIVLMVDNVRGKTIMRFIVNGTEYTGYISKEGKLVVNKPSSKG